MKALKKIADIYKIQIIVSLTLFAAIMALLLPRSPFNITMIALGCLAGTFVLDLDYFIYAYITDPTEDFSLTLKGFLRHKDYTNAVSYIFYHRDDVKERTLHSVLFQVVLAALSFFMVFSPLNLFTKTLILSAFANSLYRISEAYFEERAVEWFWLLKKNPPKKALDPT